MSGGEDVIPPLDREKRSPIRITLTTSLVISVIVAAVPVLVSWGVYQQRLATIERDNERQDKAVESQAAVIARLDANVAEVRIANAELKATIPAVFQRLDSIDRQMRRGE